MNTLSSSLRRSAWLLGVGALLIGAIACDEDDEAVPQAGTLTITLSESVDGAAVIDTATDPDNRYTNLAGNDYAIELFEYLLTEFAVSGAATGKAPAQLGGAHYRNAVNDLTNTFTLKNVPVGDYDQMSFYWGVPEEMNFIDPDGADGLPGDFEFLAWPAHLGSGYHCSRLNGFHYDDQGSELGRIALHMGRLDKGDGTVTNCHTKIDLSGLDFSVENGKETHLTLVLDVDKLTNDPLIDFTVPAGMMGWDMTMPNHMAQAAMRDNMNDVFSVVVEP